MRAILLILILAVIVLIVAIASGMLDVSQTRMAKAPEVDVTQNGITATGGQAPAFDVETGTVSVGAKPTNVVVPAPTLNVNPAGNDAQTVANNAQ
ncbi:MAG TPA: hypothetical protein VJ775_06545 [Sphingomicrobium sp.]|nr:hypothetical protein [Sphingomicrobium sp.]